MPVSILNVLIGMQAFFMFFAILCGGIFFSEFNTFTPQAAIGFFVGIVVVFGGVYGLAPVNATVANDDDGGGDSSDSHKQEALLPVDATATATATVQP